MEQRRESDQDHEPESENPYYEEQLAEELAECLKHEEKVLCFHLSLTGERARRRRTGRVHDLPEAITMQTPRSTTDAMKTIEVSLIL
jgi:hypothetical protein